MLKVRFYLKSALCVLILTYMISPIFPQESLANKPERLEWLKDAGLGLFIHWGVDSQIGTVISHSLVGASEDFAERFFNNLPQTFNPSRFDPDEWARLVKIAGFKYAVFTTKHHSGFCMFHTESHAFITQENWEWGTKKTFVLKSVQATEKTKVSVLGQNDLILEYQPGVSPKTVWTQKENGLHITVTRAQRIYNDRTWPNPVVLKITNAK